MKSIFFFGLVALSLLSIINFTYANSVNSCTSLDHKTICELSNGTKACCPIKEASCCASGDFCCPKNFKCDLKNNRCVKDSLFIPFHLRLQEISNHLEVTPKLGKDILCPDNQTTCKDTQTCCLFQGDLYGCCPIRDAICCDDKVHCCPNNYQCNPSQGKCDRKTDKYGLFSISWQEKLKGKKVPVKTVECPDGESECPDGSTCCQLESGQYGCCPLANAVCCSDHEHCCPSGFTCDVKDGRCNKNGVALPFYHKISAKKVIKKVVNKVKTVECPDGESECPDGSTCCQLDSGSYGCCPLANASCCSDHEHCCPNGYTCDVKDGRCNKGDLSIPFYLKLKAKPIRNNIKTVECPDGESECPDGSTCCQLDSGEYGCCPLPNAVCCSDHEHFCPNGYVCDVKDSRCNKGDLSIPFYPKLKAKPIRNNVKTVECPDGESECPDGSTCCQLDSGQYGCCPLVNASCCSDHEHCCPNGYTCDVKDGRCNKGDLSIPFYPKLEAKPIRNKVKTVECPDGESECPDGSTCCQLDSGSYGCCPLANAVCCSDHIHCCPNGYTCDVKDGRCNQGDLYVSFFVKVVATKKNNKPSQESFQSNEPSRNTLDKSILDVVLNNVYSKPTKSTSNLTSVVCPDGSSFCPNGSTCCKLSGGSYGCCLLPNAVCCQDGLHCCPQNFVCNLQKQACESASGNGDLQDWIHKTPSSALLNTSNEPTITQDPVTCPDNSTCDPLKVCCKVTDGSYGCCPYSDGICCGNSFCCPGNSVCGSKLGECVPKKPSMISPKLNWHTIEVKAKTLEEIQNVETDKQKPFGNDVCPGGEVLCSSNNSTCCQKADGNYSCCPYKKGVCCGSHGCCCPNGYTCDDKLEACTLNDPDSIEEPIKIVSSNKKKLIQARLASMKALDEETQTSSVDCTDGIHYCSDTSTCCPYKAESGDVEYGCCPRTNAICCNDGINCCPQGFECTTNPSGCRKINIYPN